MTRSFRAELSRRILLFDGATGTTLQAMGLPVGVMPEMWLFENPAAVVKTHRGYVEAGADVVISNSLGANRFRLRDTPFAGRAYEVSRRAAELAREAAGERAFVAGSVGSTGVLLALGEVPENDILDAYEEQIRGLVDGGADLIAVETMTDVEEACLAVRAAKAVCSLPVVATMTFEPGKRGYRTVMGTDIATAALRLQEAGADATGSNCGTGIDDMVAIIREMRAHTTLPLLAEPNAGLPQVREGKVVYGESPEYMAARVPDLLRAGARLIGGCCGTTADHIKLFRKAIDAWQEGATP
ncbi:MAG: homocysteine S-methyltransferase family protein [candidate division KSB1 bacterium]|nr:homocysteine S-methyltransferase family protein [candidate division KSB1 bacterium]MDZ7294098.1 homocysteine S-methyltransferase family protein [candidate division KSB1 bacterium]MDZ7385330.1 homocysteine S-methyltransferase family protein [candidate division KSB1 bacterium]MDZ7392748.1 homocysteine S-methyltransferase family protein [candidate division KSB1 bacterium]MDZ7414291.1 homocysteine S-methyltransferase family protein [candidate division KSB1 bacterium]